MRVRSRSSGLATYSNHITGWNNQGRHDDYGVATWSSTLSSEYINDRGGKREWLRGPHGARRLKMSPVKHVRWRFSPFTDNQDVLTYNSGGTMAWASTNGCAILVNNPFWSDVGAAFAGLMNSYVPTAPTGSYDRWEAIKPTMTTRANAFVFLYELRDLKRMLEVLPKKHFRLNDWKEVLKYLNDLHLNYNFGWKPFLRDLQAFRKAYLSFAARLNRFILDQDRDMHRHKSDKAAPVSSSAIKWGQISGWDVYYSASGDYTLASTYDFSYTLPSYEWDDLRWRAWLDSLGLNLTAANIWRVIPWSFVVDWFYNVSKVLDQATEDWIVPWVDYLQGCHSRHAELTGSLWLKLPSTGAQLTAGAISVTLYDRCLGSPVFSGKTPDLDADKIRLLASLVAGRVL